MGLPRSTYVKEGEEGVYHCFTRCVRRAFLCGFDPVTQRDYSHRRKLLLDRLRQLAAIFAIDVCAYAIMENHYHLILRLLPHLAAAWSDHEIALRWLTLFPRRNHLTGELIPLTETQISALAIRTDRIAQLRKRLSSLSWFMARLNEFIARAANKEDNVKGRYWESRFKCVKLLDLTAITACMVYVDLNPIRAQLAATPEESDFTSIQERIRAWHSQASTVSNNEMQALGQTAGVLSGGIPADDPVPSANWLCPIQSNTQRRGILHITEAEYFAIVDRSGRLLRDGKPGTIDPALAPVLLRIGIKSDTWLDTVLRFESRFHLAAGLLSSLRSFAGRIGRRWIAGVSAAETAFTSPAPQSA